MSFIDDRTRLRHMLEAAQSAIRFADNRNREELDNDEQLVFALVHALQIIGEAASKISSELRNANPQIPWVVIIGIRNRLVHAYHDVDLDIIWDTVQNDLLGLIVELEKLITPEE